MEVLDLSALDFSEGPDSLARNGYDGIWVELQDRPSPSPLRGRVLQWLDWKLQGQLSRWILAANAADQLPVFIPTMRKVPPQYVVLVRRFDLGSLRQNCEGLSLKKILLVCEDPSRAVAVRKEIQGKPGAWPQWIDLGFEKNAKEAA